jgi:hypothetical protein
MWLGSELWMHLPTSTLLHCIGGGAVVATVGFARRAQAARNIGVNGIGLEKSDAEAAVSSPSAGPAAGRPAAGCAASDCRKGIPGWLAALAVVGIDDSKFA